MARPLFVEVLIHPDHVPQRDAVLLDPLGVAAFRGEEVPFDPSETESGLLVVREPSGPPPSATW